MSVENTSLEILGKKFGFLERRVTYLEGKCRGQGVIITELQEKLEKIENGIESQAEIVSPVSEHKVPVDSDEDVKPSLDSLQISNGGLPGNLVRSGKNCEKLSQKLIVQMGVRCETNPLFLHPNRASNGNPQISQTKTETTKANPQKDVKNVEISTRPKSSGSSVKRGVKKVKKVGSHICAFCSKSFQGFENLSTHMRTHTGERPFKCKICSRSFKGNGDLKRHNRIHTGDVIKSHICGFCSKSFRFFAHLSDHMRTHTGEKPFKCKICLKSFNQSQILIRHNRIHTGERPFKCNICSKSFNQSQSLTIHNRIHTDEKPHEKPARSVQKGSQLKDTKIAMKKDVN